MSELVHLTVVITHGSPGNWRTNGLPPALNYVVAEQKPNLVVIYGLTDFELKDEQYTGRTVYTSMVVDELIRWTEAQGKRVVVS